MVVEEAPLEIAVYSISYAILSIMIIILVRLSIVLQCKAVILILFFLSLNH